MTQEVFQDFRLSNGRIVHIRTPNEKDAENMIRYFNIVGGETDNLLFGKDEFGLSIEQEREHIKNMETDENSIILLALDGAEIVAVAQIFSYKRERIAHNAEISISVKKKYWGHGIGRKMMDLNIEFAKNNTNIINISLGVNSNNVPAIELYKKVGFEIVGIHRRNFRQGEELIDELLMDLYL